MDLEHHPEKGIDLSRRKFVKLGAASAVAGSAMVATLPSTVMAEASKSMTAKQTAASLANKIDSSVYQRFHQKDTAFCQALSGPLNPNPSSSLGLRWIMKP